jgi:hypothetical protein
LTDGVDSYLILKRATAKIKTSLKTRLIDTKISTDDLDGRFKKYNKLQNLWKEILTMKKVILVK